MVKLQNLLNEKSKGLWHNIHAKRKRGEAPAKPGDEDYPKTLDIDEKVIKVSKKDDVPGNPMKMRGEEKIKKLVYSGSNGTGSYEIKGKNLNVIGIRPRDKGFFVRHFTNNTGFRKANLYYDGVQWQGDKKFESVNESDLGLTLKKGKTIKVTHEKSGKELVIIDKPNVRKEYEKIGYFAEGSCGYGIDGKVGSQPAGPHLIKKKKKKVDESVNERRQYKSGSQEMNFIVQQLVKYGNTKSDAIKMTQKHYNDVLKRYKEPWFVHPTKKAEIISSLSANESVNEAKYKGYDYKRQNRKDGLPLIVPALRKTFSNMKDLKKYIDKHGTMEGVNEDLYYGYYKNKEVKVNAKSDKDAKKQIISKLKIPKGDLNRASMINHTKNSPVAEGKANIYGVEYRKVGQSGAKFQKSSLTMVSHQGRKMHKKMTMAIIKKAEKLRKQDNWADYRITVNGAPYIGWGGKAITGYPQPKLNEAPGKSGKDEYVGTARVKVEPGTYKGQRVNFHEVSMYRDHKKPYHYYLTIRLAHSDGKKVDMVISTGTHIQSKAGKWAQGFIKRRVGGTGKERFS